MSPRIPGVVAIARLPQAQRRRNALIGGAIFSFVGFVYGYTYYQMSKTNEMKAIASELDAARASNPSGAPSGGGAQLK